MAIEQDDGEEKEEKTVVDQAWTRTKKEKRNPGLHAKSEERGVGGLL